MSEQSVDVAGLRLYPDVLEATLPHIDVLSRAFGAGGLAHDKALAAIRIIGTPGLANTILELTDPREEPTAEAMQQGAAQLGYAMHVHGSRALRTEANRIDTTAVSDVGYFRANQARKTANSFIRLTHPNHVAEMPGAALLWALRGLRASSPMFHQKVDGALAKGQPYIEAMSSQAELEADIRNTLSVIEQRAYAAAAEQRQSPGQLHVAAAFRNTVWELLSSAPAAQEYAPLFSNLIAAHGITEEDAREAIAKLPDPNLVQFGMYPIIKALNSVLPPDQRNLKLEQLAHFNPAVRAAVRIGAAAAKLAGKHGINRKLSALPSIGPVLQGLHRHLPENPNGLREPYSKLRSNLAVRSVVGPIAVQAT